MATGFSKDPRNRKARSALAKSNNITLNIEGIYEADRLKFASMAQDFGVTFDGNNNVLDNSEKERSLSNKAYIDRRESLRDCTIISDVTISNTTTETEIFSCSVPANSLQVKDVFKVIINGLYSIGNSSQYFTCRIKIDGTTIDSFQSPLKTVADTPAELESVFTIRSLGTSGSVSTMSRFEAPNEDDKFMSYTSSTINTTVLNELTITVQFSDASASNNAIIKQGFVRVN